PSLSHLLQALPAILSPTDDPHLKIAWVRDVLFLVEKTVRDPPGPASDPIVARLDKDIRDEGLKRAVDVALGVVLEMAGSGERMAKSNSSGGSCRASALEKEQLESEGFVINTAVYTSAVKIVSCCEPTKMEISVVMMLVLLGGFFMAMGTISVFRDVCWRHRAARQANRRQSHSLEDGEIFVVDLPFTNQHAYPRLPHPHAPENRVHLAPGRASNNGRERHVNVSVTHVDDDTHDF
ncbi:hypothetical protein CVT24_002237, partial [Panaeolus cyanescens]